MRLIYINNQMRVRNNSNSGICLVLFRPYIAELTWYNRRISSKRWDSRLPLLNRQSGHSHHDGSSAPPSHHSIMCTRLSVSMRCSSSSSEYLRSFLLVTVRSIVGFGLTVSPRGRGNVLVDPTYSNLGLLDALYSCNMEHKLLAATGTAGVVRAHTICKPWLCRARNSKQTHSCAYTNAARVKTNTSVHAHKFYWPASFFVAHNNWFCFTCCLLYDVLAARRSAHICAQKIGQITYLCDTHITRYLLLQRWVFSGPAVRFAEVYCQRDHSTTVSFTAWCGRCCGERLHHANDHARKSVHPVGVNFKKKTTCS